jgi:hypothetical protein
MAIDVEDLGTKMFDAAFGVVKAKAPSIKTYVETETTKLAHTLATIESERALGQISEEEAAILVDMQKSAMRSVLLTAEGLGLLMVERAINAALDIAKPIVNAAVGFVLL